MSKRAFDGIRILDFTQVLAGPFATQQLAQLGAEVIKVEQPGVGDITRGGIVTQDADHIAPSFLTCNVGKKSIALDLKHPEGKEIIHRLVATTDAVVENFKPGVIRRLGFGYEDLERRLNPIWSTAPSPVTDRPDRVRRCRVRRRDSSRVGHGELVGAPRHRARACGLLRSRHVDRPSMPRCDCCRAVPSCGKRRRATRRRGNDGQPPSRCRDRRWLHTSPRAPCRP